MRAARLLMALIVPVAACSESGRPVLTLSAVSPSGGPAGQATALRIRGAGFRPLVHANFDDDERSYVSAAFVALLGDRTLEQVTFVDEGELSAVAPASLSPGLYDLTVVDPAGAGASLPDAFTVLGAVDGGTDAASDGPPADARPDGPSADAAPDGPPSDAAPDGPPADTTPPDTTPPDIIPTPDGPLYYVKEEFSSGMGSVTPKSGSWSVGSGTLDQSSSSQNGVYAVVPVAAASYIAETRMAIHSIQGVGSVAEGAGLGVRVQSQGNPSNPPGQYTCFLSADSKLFGIVECSGGQTYCPIRSSTPVSFSYNTYYVVRATVSGSSITCQLPSQNKTLSINDSTYPTGGAALVTFHASASFDYLRVWAP